jgi:transcriptional regulator with XRE-family HTH domain
MVATDLKALLGVAIKTERSVLGISQEKLAQALKLSVSALFERASNGRGSRDVVEILLVEDDRKTSS